MITQSDSLVPVPTSAGIATAFIPLQFVAPKPRPNYDTSVLVPLHAAQKAHADVLAAAARVAAVQAADAAAMAAAIVPAAPQTPPPVVGNAAKDFIYSHESGNNPGSINPTSGACGIGQALPCSKLPCSLADYACQDAWFTNVYMIPRYGTWEAAAAFWSCIGLCTDNYGTVVKTNTWW